MKRETISDAIGKISTKNIVEAENYLVSADKTKLFRCPFGRFIIAAALVLCLVLGSIAVLKPPGGIAVSAYAYGADEEITSAGAVLNTGTISDSGEMKGHPLMFYLSGDNIATVRFSCKNQQIDFVDWTEKRDEYGTAQNFTVCYGEDESEYYYLVIDWVPDGTIRALTDNEAISIAMLPDELREDIIVMEITFADGKTETKAITISLLEDGTFFAAFDQYKITKKDLFVERTDSKPVSRDILYSQGETVWSGEYPFGEAPIIEGDYRDADPNEPPTEVIPGSITFTGTIIKGTEDADRPSILVEAAEDSALPYDSVLFYLNTPDKNWASKTGSKVQITCTDAFNESLPPIGSLISICEFDSGT